MVHTSWLFDKACSRRVALWAQHTSHQECAALRAKLCSASVQGLRNTKRRNDQWAPEMGIRHVNVLHELVMVVLAQSSLRADYPTYCSRRRTRVKNWQPSTPDETRSRAARISDWSVASCLEVRAGKSEGCADRLQHAGLGSAVASAMQQIRVCKIVSRSGLLSIFELSLQLT